MKKIFVLAASLLAISSIGFASADCSYLYTYYLSLQSKSMGSSVAGIPLAIAQATALDKYNICLNAELDAAVAKAKAEAEDKANTPAPVINVKVDIVVTGTVSTGIVAGIDTGTEEKVIVNPTDELYDSIQWMFNGGLTKYTNTATFLPDANITREQASKFFSQFSINILKRELNTSIACDFKDNSSIDSTLQESVKQSCQLGLFKGSNGYFKPQDSLTTAQIIAVAVRLAYGNMDESSSKRWINYQNKAEGLNLTNQLGLEINDVSSATRGNTAMILFRLSQQIKN